MKRTRAHWVDSAKFWTFGQIPGALGVLIGTCLAAAPRLTSGAVVLLLFAMATRTVVVRVRGGTENSARSALPAVFVLLIAISVVLGFATGIALVLHARGAGNLLLLTLGAGAVLPLLTELALRVRALRRRPPRIAVRL